MEEGLQRALQMLRAAALVRLASRLGWRVDPARATGLVHRHSLARAIAIVGEKNEEHRGVIGAIARVRAMLGIRH